MYRKHFGLLVYHLDLARLHARHVAHDFQSVLRLYDVGRRRTDRPRRRPEALSEGERSHGMEEAAEGTLRKVRVVPCQHGFLLLWGQRERPPCGIDVHS